MTPLPASPRFPQHGLGCEPASAATIAGLKNLLAEGVIARDERIACVLTGHTLKDPNVTVNYHKDNQGPFSTPPHRGPQRPPGHRRADPLTRHE